MGAIEQVRKLSLFRFAIALCETISTNCGAIVLVSLSQLAKPLGGVSLLRSMRIRFR